MATKKDLVEAYSFSRRRLVTAFVSGAPGGREVEPARPGRTIVGGLALAVLLIAGAAIAGIFSPRVPDDWTEPGLIVSKQEGEAYVITEPESGDEDAPPVLRPVLNITSAKLILGADTTPRIVPQDEIDGEEIGEDIGILGAPATVPSTDQLIESGWTACTADNQGVRVAVAEESPVDPVSDGAFLVSHDGSYYVIAVSEEETDEAARAYSYQLPDDDGARDKMLAALGLGTTTANATEVSQDWLGLFPEGLPLELSSFSIDNLGDRPAPGETGGDTDIPSNAKVGDILTIGTERLVMLDDGPAPLTEFAYAVYKNLPEEPRERPLEASPDVLRQDAPYAGAHWPENEIQPIDQQPCAVLLPTPGERPAVLPGRLTADDTSVEDTSVEASSVGVTSEGKAQAVQAGRGALVLSGEWTDTSQGRLFLIDAKGKYYELVGPDTPVQLGYSDFDVPVVPDRWVEMFREGVALSRDAALCPPALDSGVTC